MSEETKDQEITRDLTISDLFDRYPQKAQKLAQVLTNAGLQCVGCGAATYETLEVGMLGHGMSEEQIDQLVERLNEVLEEKADLSTITLTQSAAEKFKEIAAEDGKEGWALRFGDKPGGCSGFEYVLDFSEKLLETDELLHSNGVDIHIDKAALERLLGCEIDFVDGLMGAGFKISNPNAKGSCGCGKSQAY